MHIPVFLSLHICHSPLASTGGAWRCSFGVVGCCSCRVRVCRCRGCCSLSVCVCDLLIFLQEGLDLGLDPIANDVFAGFLMPLSSTPPMARPTAPRRDRPLADRLEPAFGAHRSSSPNITPIPEGHARPVDDRGFPEGMASHGSSLRFPDEHSFGYSSGVRVDFAGAQLSLSVSVYI